MISTKNHSCRFSWICLNNFDCTLQVAFAEMLFTKVETAGDAHGLQFSSRSDFDDAGKCALFAHFESNIFPKIAQLLDILDG